MIEKLAAGLLLILVAVSILVYSIGANLYGFSYLILILPIVFAIFGAALTLWYIVNRNHKE